MSNAEAGTRSPEVERPYGVAVVGCGIGQAHAAAYRALSDKYELRVICDVDAARAEKLARGDASYGLYPVAGGKKVEHRAPDVLTDFAALCQRDDVDIVDLCTPPHMHFAQCRQALAAGRHVICEKPLVGSLKEVDGLAAAEEKSGKHLMPIFQYRFGHGLQKLRYLVSSGLAGKAYLATVETHWRRRADYYSVPWRGNWKTELGGCLLGHAIHAHDGFCYVAGAVKSVFARIATRVNPVETEDCASVSLEMADGSLASLSVTLGSQDEISRLRFCFANLVAESNTKPYGNSTDPWRFIGDTPDLQKQIDEALARFVPQPEGYEGQFTRFHAALVSGTRPPVTVADSRSALELITAMYHSAATGKPVKLPITKRHPRYECWAP
ncbi:MAG: Gfo/Idh/MocA family oxidoreductase [Planctomycetota bacterium]|nr:Gfo/Idh/MocA family oxidoreductase [Planctomycetota bacterium]